MGFRGELRMQKKKRGLSKGSTAYAEAWRKFLKELLNAKVRTKKDRDDLAQKMGVSSHYINSMLYRQEGGIDAWASALSIAYDIKVKDIGSIFTLLKTSVRKAAPLSMADELWNRLDELVDENEKFYWISLLHGLIVADRDFKK